MLIRGNSAPVQVSIMLQDISPTRSPVLLNKAPPLAPDWTQQVVCSMATGSDTRVTMPRVTVGRTLSSSEKSENPAAITGSPGGFIRRYENSLDYNYVDNACNHYVGVTKAQQPGLRGEGRFQKVLTKHYTFYSRFSQTLIQVSIP